MGHPEDDKDKAAAEAIRRALQELHNAVISARQLGLRVNLQCGAVGYDSFVAEREVLISRERQL